MSVRPRLLDTFCKAGGCTKGYQRAGFYVVGVDIEPQPRYCGDEFVQGDALEFIAQHGHAFDVIHASPPCQRFSTATRCNKNQARCKKAADHPDLIDPTRELLLTIAKPWVIENVPGAPIQGLLLCGTMFGLKVIRHRFFECSIHLWSPGQRCWHPSRGKVGRAGVGGKKIGDWISVAGSTDLKVASSAMGIDWMKNRKEIAQAIPPAYTEFIGRQLIDQLERSATEKH